MSQIINMTSPLHASNFPSDGMTSARAQLTCALSSRTEDNPEAVNPHLPTHQQLTFSRPKTVLRTITTFPPIPISLMHHPTYHGDYQHHQGQSASLSSSEEKQSGIA